MLLLLACRIYMFYLVGHRFFPEWYVIFVCLVVWNRVWGWLSWPGSLIKHQMVQTQLTATVSHPDTNWTRCRVTALIKTDVLLRCQTTVYRRGCVLHGVCLLSTLHDNYRSDLNETFTRDVMGNRKNWFNFRSYSLLDLYLEIWMRCPGLYADSR